MTDKSVQGGVCHRSGMKILALIGYARVSTEDQATFSQLDDLRAAGCQVVFEEKASGANRARPELARAVARVGRGDILVVARIDRLGGAPGPPPAGGGRGGGGGGGVQG